MPNVKVSSDKMRLSVVTRSGGIKVGDQIKLDPTRSYFIETKIIEMTKQLVLLKPSARDGVLAKMSSIHYKPKKQHIESETAPVNLRNNYALVFEANLNEVQSSVTVDWKSKSAKAFIKEAFITPAQSELDLVQTHWKSYTLGSTDGSTILKDAYGIPVTVSSFKTLEPPIRLNDEVINIWINHLNFKHQGRVFYLSTFFFNKLYSDLGSFDFKGVMKWTKRIKNLFDLDIIGTIVNVKRQHWFPVIVYLKLKEIHILD
jgi:hypothetical protein